MADETCLECGGELGQRWVKDAEMWETFCRGCGDVIFRSNYFTRREPEREEDED